MIGTSFHVFIFAYKHDIVQYHICYYSVISDTTHARNAHAYVHVHVFMQHSIAYMYEGSRDFEKEV